MNYEEIGKYLAGLRKLHKITQDELANKLGVSRQAVSKWETGSSLPDIEIFMKMSQLYGVTVNDIVNADHSKINSGNHISLPGKIKSSNRIFVIGCGRWGTFLAWYLDKIGHDVSLYGREESIHMKQLHQERKNEYVSLSENIQLTSDLSKAKDADSIVISIGAQGLYLLCIDLNNVGVTSKKIVLCMKGIEISTGRRLSQIADDELDFSNKVAVWLGPGHVQEFVRGVPNCMVIDSKDEFLKDELIRAFSSDLIRFYYGIDLVGNEIGAAAKNVIGIAAGMLDGLDLGTLKGALMARGTREIAKLIVALGGKDNSIYGLCHLGDYEATVFSKHSQNRMFGERVVLGKSYDKLCEGFYTVKALRNLGKNYGVELPICEAVYQILYCQKHPSTILDMLLSRSLKNEF